MTIEEIIKSYLSECLIANQSVVFGNHIIQTKLPDYGVTVCGKLHSSDTYSRAWRSIREVNEDQKELGITEVNWEGFKITEEPGVDSREKYFRVRRM